jgi:hypothetical protein
MPIGIRPINNFAFVKTFGSIGANNSAFDLNGDFLVNQADRMIWIKDLRKTWVGDANLDNEFNRGDFVQVFQTGEHEDTVAANSTWADGDWDGDHEFNSGDFVSAFQDGGFEKGPRPAVSFVPEPSGFELAILGAIALMDGKRTHASFVKRMAASS